MGLSINLNRILALPRLPERGLQTLFTLLALLIVSSLMLVPGQSSTDLGLELLAVGGAAWIFSTRLDIGNLRQYQGKQRIFWVQNTIVGQAALLPYLAGGVSTLVIGLDGLYWLVVAVVFSYLKAIIDAWVLLIEINR